MTARPKALLLALLAAVPALAASLPSAPAATAATPRGEWLKGDFHVHSSFSHDACAFVGPPGDAQECFREPWLWGYTPEEVVREAELRGLDFLALTDHQTIAGSRDPGYRSQRLTLLTSYEHSLDEGHAGFHGVSRTYRGFPEATTADVAALVERVHRDGGLVVANHPSAVGSSWDYDAMPTDAVEVWNGPWQYRQPLVPAGGPSNNHRALADWSARLDAGQMLRAVGGSDSHLRLTNPVSGVGQPTTWVFAEERTPDAILAAVRLGRAFISAGFAGPQLHLHADADADGAFETMMGDVARPGGNALAFETRVVGAPPGARVRLVANSSVAWQDVVALPDQTFRATLGLPGDAWVRAEVLLEPDYSMLALTNPIHVRPAPPTGLRFASGDLHAHTAYSDGRGAPREAYAAARAAGLDFFALTEHSEAFHAPFGPREDCSRDPFSCLQANPSDHPKWEATARAAAEATAPGAYVGLRGFEWTSDLQRHVNVLFSKGFTDRGRTPEPSMSAWWSWFTTPPPTGGADGLGQFNHPLSQKCIPCEAGGRDPLQWDGFRHRPDADARQVTIEVLNRGKSHLAGYPAALARGWHVAPVAVSDTHERDWGAPRYGRTLLLVGDLSEAGVREALLARRAAATTDPELRVAFEAGGWPMGARLQARAEGEIELRAWAQGASRAITRAALVDAAGAPMELPVPPGARSLDVRALVPVGAIDDWVYLHLELDGGGFAVTAPVWVEAT